MSANPIGWYFRDTPMNWRHRAEIMEASRNAWRLAYFGQFAVSPGLIAVLLIVGGLN